MSWTKQVSTYRKVNSFLNFYTLMGVVLVMKDKVQHSKLCIKHLLACNFMITPLTKFILQRTS